MCLAADEIPYSNLSAHSIGNRFALLPTRHPLGLSSALRRTPQWQLNTALSLHSICIGPASAATTGGLAQRSIERAQSTAPYFTLLCNRASDRALTFLDSFWPPDNPDGSSCRDAAMRGPGGNTCRPNEPWPAQATVGDDRKTDIERGCRAQRHGHGYKSAHVCSLPRICLNELRSQLLVVGICRSYDELFRCRV